MFVVHQFRDARNPGTHHRHAQGHAFGQDIGNPVPVAVSGDPAAKHEAVGLLELLQYLFMGQGPGQGDMPGEIQRPDSGGNKFPVIAIANEDIAEGKPFPGQQCQGFEDIGDPFFLHQTGDGEKGVGWGRGSLHRMGKEQRQVDAVVYAMDSVAMPDQVFKIFFVVSGAGNDEAGLVDLLGDLFPVRGIDILGVGRETERDAAYFRAEHGNGGGAVGEMGMQMGDVLALGVVHQIGCLKKMLEGHEVAVAQETPPGQAERPWHSRAGISWRYSDWATGTDAGTARMLRADRSHLPGWPPRTCG